MYRLVSITAACLAAWLSIGAASPQPAFDGAGSFVGSTPCDEDIRAQLGIPRDYKADLIEWAIELRRDGNGAGTYELAASYGPSVPNLPGLGATKQTVRKSGAWRTESGGAANLPSRTHHLDGSVVLAELSPDVFHLVGTNGKLLSGNGGWSYSLSRKRPPVQQLPPTPLEEPRSLTPLETGANVLGVFEGRTPGLEIGRIVRPAASLPWKIKWRVTLFVEPDSPRPNRYKVEGTIYPNATREGAWTLVRNGDIQIYRLIHLGGDGPIYLRKVDDNVLYFSDASGVPLVGNGNFSYALDRRASAPAR